MWYFEGEPVNDIYTEIINIGEENRDSFSIDDLIDDIYPPREILGVPFYSSIIVKTLDESLYEEFISEEIECWARDLMDTLERAILNEGTTLDEAIDMDWPEFKDYVWRNEEEE